jgi:ABC-2 type transport system ATP-binding protein
MSLAVARGLYGMTLRSGPVLAIETHGLVKVFGDNRAVDGIDLAVPRGTVF